MLHIAASQVGDSKHMAVMNEVRAQSIQCPYCGETIDVLIDCSISQQSYIEDCQVCCRPIEFNVVVDQEGESFVSVFSENE